MSPVRADGPTERPAGKERTLPQPTYPGLYIEELPSGVRPIEGVPTSIAVFVGRTERGSSMCPVPCRDFRTFADTFGTTAPGLSDLPWAVKLFFDNGGTDCHVLRIEPPPADPTSTEKQPVVGAGEDVAPEASDYRIAFEILDREVDLFNLLVLPRDHTRCGIDQAELWADASAFCQRRRALLLVDPPVAWKDATTAAAGVEALRRGLVCDHAAVFFPRLRIPVEGRERVVGPSGAVAGLLARCDEARGVWTAPAGAEAVLRGVVGLEHELTDGDNGVLNPRGVNAIRSFPQGHCLWGSRTLEGYDGSGSDFKYIPIRRLASFIEESVCRGTEWTVFEPNGAPLWAQIRLNVGAFMHSLFRQGAFQGETPREAYLVKCDGETTTQDDIDEAIVKFWVGFAALKPAEFVVLQFQQKTAVRQS